MSKSKHSEAQIIAALKQVEAGRTVDDVARECGVSKHTIYAWKSRFGGMDASEAQKLRALEDENGRLKRLVADMRGYAGRSDASFAGSPPRETSSSSTICRVSFLSVTSTGTISALNAPAFCAAAARRYDSAAYASCSARVIFSSRAQSSAARSRAARCTTRARRATSSRKSPRSTSAGRPRSCSSRAARRAGRASRRSSARWRPRRRRSRRR